MVVQTAISANAELTNSRRTSAPVSPSRSQKELLSKYLYDDVGSASLRGDLPPPRVRSLTRADERLLRRHADGTSSSALPTPVAVAELGSGSGKKTRQILEALCRRQRTQLLSHRDFSLWLWSCASANSVTSIASAFSASSASTSTDYSKSPPQRHVLACICSCCSSAAR
jgi:uncharacterized SAM-dependent methyltransferase